MPPSIAFLVPLGLLGCNLAPKPSDTDPAADDTGLPAATGTIFEINDGTIAENESVTLAGVIVASPITRPDSEGVSYGFFVADPAGGIGSGLYVWSSRGVTSFPIAQGDEITITGTVSEFYGWRQLSVADADALEKTGTGTVPPPIELGTGDGVDWETYTSTLVTLSTQTVESINEFSTGTLSSGLALDDGFQYLDYDCGGQFASLTGIIFYTYETFSLNPRADADLGAYSPSQTVIPGTVADARAESVCGRISLSGLVVTSEEFGADESMFFVQDPAGGENSGIAVLTRGTTYDVTVGDVVSIIGSVGNAYGLTEIIVDDTAEIVKDGSQVPTNTDLTEAPTDWEPYEGMLVTLHDLEILTDEEYGQSETNYGLLIGDELGDFLFGEGDAYGAATGIVYFSYGEFVLEPRFADDLVP